MAHKKQRGGEVIQRSMIVSRDDWIEAKVKAARLNLSVSDVIRDLMRQWLADKVELSDKVGKD